MRCEFTFLERGYLANLCRRRVTELRANAEKKSMSSQKQELIEEAEHIEGIAQRFDDGEEPEKVVSIPRTAQPGLDINYVDEPKKEPTA